MKKVVDIVTRAVSSRGGQMAAFAAMYVLLAVEYYRFVYVNYYYLMGFDFRLEPVAVVAGFFMLAVAMAAMFLLPGEEKGSYALSMLVALLLCLPSTVMYQFGGVSVFVPLYALLFLLLLRTPLLDMGRWRLPRLPVRYQRYLLPALCLLCLLPFPLAYGLEGIDLSLLTMGEETYDVRAAVSERDTLLTAYLMGPLRMVLLQQWKGLGWSAIIYFAAISGISQDMFEAAMIDGANRIQRIWYITIPSLIPTYFVLLIMSIGNFLNTGVDQYLTFGNALNKQYIEVLDLYVYNLGIGSGQISFSVAVGIMKSVVALVLFSSANLASKKIRGESVF